MLPEIYLVRHGQSTWNLEGRVQGQRDEAVLTELGLRQALQAAERLRAAGAVRLLSSDLQRAAQTADVIGRELGLEVELTPLLREHDHGSLSGLLAAEALEVWGADPDAPFDPDLKQGGGESTRDVARRVGELYAGVDDGPVIAVTHGALIQVAICVALGEDLAEMPWRAVANGDVVRTDGTTV